MFGLDEERWCKSGVSFRASASSWIIFLNALIMPNLLNTSSLRVGDADHGLRALL
jgi:hypothetical protein